MTKLHIPTKRSILPYVIVLGLIVFCSTIGISIYKNSSVADAAPAGWSAGRIIDDSVFTAHTSMSAASIQSFLNGKVPTCDTNGQQISEFGGSDLNGDGRVQRWEWGKQRYNQTVFRCLKDYTEGGKKASQIIYDVAQKYKISPRVLLVLLQKEQSLVTDTWPLNIQYRSATGYGCPDTAPCDSQYYGLTNQLDWAAKMFRSIMNASPTWYTPYILGNNRIQYNPDSRCGSGIVNIQNRATQALYNYTPYQPNTYALNGGSSSAYPNCGAFGNRNFFTYFSSWFSRPNAAATYGYSVVSQNVYSDANYTTGIGTTNASIKPGDELYVKVVVKNTGNQTWYQDLLRLGTSNPQDRTSVFRNASWVSGQRPTAMQEESVAAGGQATFKFKITAPAALGNYDESFGVVIEGQRWLIGAFKFTFNVASPDPIYSAQKVSFDIYKDATRKTKLNTNSISTYTGSKLYVTAKIKNVGNRDFPLNLTKFATSNPHDRVSGFSDASWLSTTRATTATEGLIEPGKTGTFNFTMTAPSSAGSYQEQFGLVIEGQRWVSDNVGVAKITVAERPPAQLTRGGILQRGQSLLSTNESFRLTLQTDGNLVLYNSSGKALWHTRTTGKSANKLILQTDGNLVLYSTANKALWYTKTSGRSVGKLIMQTDGNLVLYDASGRALWHTRTNQ